MNKIKKRNSKIKNNINKTIFLLKILSQTKLYGIVTLWQSSRYVVFHFSKKNVNQFLFSFFVELAANELCMRIQHAEPKVILAATGGIESCKIVK